MTPAPRRHTARQLAAALALLASLPAAQAAGPVSLTDAGSVYTQSFDTLASTGGTQTWSNGSTLEGWYLSQAIGSVTTISVTNGAQNALTGGYGSAGSTGSSDRALASNNASQVANAPRNLLLAVTNNTGADLASFSLGYDSEVWRIDGNVSIADTWTLGYRFGTSTMPTTGFTALPASFNATAPVQVGTPAATDGNSSAWRQAGRGGTQALATPWANGSTLWLRWTDLSTVSNTMAIDNVSFSVTAVTTPVPEPTPTALLLAGLAGIGFLARRRQAGR